MNKRKLALIALSITLAILAVVVLSIQVFARSSQVTLISSGELLPLVSDREAAYNQLIQQANQQIETLNQQILNGQESSVIAPENVLLVAQGLAGPDFAPTASPELVQYDGRLAYVVRYERGMLVLDANTGDLLFSDLPQRISADQAVEIAMLYLGQQGLKVSSVSETALDGIAVFEIRLGNYIVFIDHYGTVVKAQQVQYVAVSNPVVSSSSSREHDDDDHEEDDD